MPRIYTAKGHVLDLRGDAARHADHMNTHQDPGSAPVLSEMAAFVRAVAITLAPQTDYRVSRLNIILGKYTSWAHRVRGLPLAERLIFDSQVIDLYIRDAVREKKLAKSSVAAYRSVLLRASEVFLPRDDATPAREVGAQAMLAPYSPGQIDAFPTWARGQRTPLMQDKAIAVMCLGLGCGLRSGEMNRLTRGDVADGTGLTVRVSNERGARTVPMLPRYHGVFRQLIADRDEDSLVFGQPNRSIHRNSISEFLTEAKDTRLKVNTYRMRSSWIIGRLAAGVELRTLLEAADLDRLEKLGDYLPHLPPPTGASRSLLTEEVTR